MHKHNRKPETTRYTHAPWDGRPYASRFFANPKSYIGDFDNPYVQPSSWNPSRPIDPWSQTRDSIQKLFPSPSPKSQTTNPKTSRNTAEKLNYKTFQTKRTERKTQANSQQKNCLCPSTKPHACPHWAFWRWQFAPDAPLLNFLASATDDRASILELEVRRFCGGEERKTKTETSLKVHDLKVQDKGFGF